MKINNNYLLRQLFDKYYLIPVGASIINGKDVISLNEFGYTICNYLLEETTQEELISLLAKEFDAFPEELEELSSMVSDFISSLRNMEILTI